MDKAVKGKFTRFYFNCVATAQEINIYLTCTREWTLDFNDAALFSEKDAVVIEHWLASHPAKATVVKRSVNCEINGFDPGTIVSD